MGAQDMTGLTPAGTVTAPQSLHEHLLELAGLMALTMDEVERLAGRLFEVVRDDPRTEALVKGLGESTEAIPNETAGACDAVLSEWVMRERPILSSIRMMIRGISLPDGRAVPFYEFLREAFIEHFREVVQHAWEDHVFYEPPDRNIKTNATIRKIARACGDTKRRQLTTQERTEFFHGFRDWLLSEREWPRFLAEQIEEILGRSTEEKRHELVVALIDEDIFLRSAEAFLPSDNPSTTRKPRPRPEDASQLTPEELARFWTATVKCAKKLTEDRRLAYVLKLYPEYRQIELMEPLIAWACDKVARDDRQVEAVRAALDDACDPDKHEYQKWTLDGTELKILTSPFICELLGWRVGTDGLNSNFQRARRDFDACFKARYGNSA